MLPHAGAAIDGAALPRRALPWFNAAMLRRAMLALSLVACGDGARHVASSLSHAHPAASAEPADTGVPDAPDVLDAIDAVDSTDGSDGAQVDAQVDDDGADIAVASDATDASDTTDTPDTPDTPDTNDPPDGSDALAPPAGTLASPYEVDHWPYVVDDDTSLATESQLDGYGCAPQGEAGPERVYHLSFDAPGELVAEVAEADGVDVDVQLLAALPAAGERSGDCLGRANTRLAIDLEPGDYWLVVDTYSNAAGSTHAGAYRLALEQTILDRWQVVDVAPGVVWRKKVYADLAGGRQTVSSLTVDLALATVRPYVGDGCLHPSITAPAHDAIAAINAGFFDTGPGTCPSLDLVKVAGVVASYNHLNGSPQRSFGLTSEGAPIMAWVDADRDWPDAWHAIGSYPSLVTDGAVAIEPEGTSSFFVGRNPRTALGLTADGKLLLVVVDGRTDAGVGMTLPSLAQHLVDLGAVQAVNLDGGGSSAMWIRDQSVNGIVNSPSDDGDVDHGGERGVSDLLLVVPR